MTNSILLIFPLIPIIWIIGGALATAGTVTTVSGAMRLGELQARFQRRKEAYDTEYDTYQRTVASFNQFIEAHGREKVRLYERMKTWIERLFSSPYSFDRSIVDEHGVAFDARSALNKNLENSIKVIDFIATAASGMGTGATVLGGAYAAIAAFGVASTGTAISTLGGAAAAKAIWAALGGGSIAAGGFGVAGGMLAGGILVAGPALLFIGFSLHGEAEKQQTQVEQAEREMDRECAKYRDHLKVLEGIVSTVKQREHDLHHLENQIDADFAWLEEIESRGMPDDAFSEADRSRFDTLIIRLRALDSLLQKTTNG